MRLSKEQINNIQDSIFYFDKKAKIILFGSRVDDSSNGGDIDILILSPKINRQDIWKIRDNFCGQFGEQKIDIMVDDGKLDDPFKRKAYENGIML